MRQKGTHQTERQGYKTVIKPTMSYGAECWAVRKKDENRLHVAEMRMLRWIRSKTRKDHVRNQIIQDDAKVCPMPTFLRQKRLNWYGHNIIKRRKEDNLSRKIMDMVVPGRRRRRIFLFDPKTDITQIHVTIVINNQ